MSETARRMLVRGTAAARAGDHAEARRYLERVLFNDPTRDQTVQAHLWLSRITTDPSEQRQHIEEVLAANPTHAEARRALAILDGRLNPTDIIDPNIAPQPHDHPNAPTGQISAERLICPICAGRVRFEPGSTWVQCQYCGHRQPLLSAQRHQGQLEEHDFIVTLATSKGHRLPAETRAYHCQGCQATLLTTGLLSTHCPYCGSAHLLEDKVPETIQPTGIIPFALDEAEAAKILRTWLDQKLRQQAEQIRATRPRGLYLPIWTFDLVGEIGWHETEHETPNLPQRSTISFLGKTTNAFIQQVQQIGEQQFSDRSDYLIVNDIVVPATHKLPYAIADLFDSYDLERAEPYTPSYLSDWLAEQYQIAVSDASLVARRRALDKAAAKIHARKTNALGNTASGLQVFSRSLAVQAYKLLLVPIWLAHYRYQADTYAVVINGQNGQAFGESPALGLRHRVHRWFGI